MRQETKSRAPFSPRFQDDPGYDINPTIKTYNSKHTIANSQFFATSKKHEEQEPNSLKNKDSIYFKMRVINNVGYFLQKLKARAVLREPQLKESQFSYFQTSSQIKQSEDQLMGYENKWVLAYDILLLLLLLYNLWLCSYEMIFGMEDRYLRESKSLLFVDIALLILYTIYIVLFHNTEYKNYKLQIVSSRQLIFDTYFANKLAPDILIYVTLIIKISGLDEVHPSIFYLTRIALFMLYVPCCSILNKLQNIISVSSTSESVVIMIKLVFRIFAFVHFLSLLLNAFVKIEHQYGIENNWLTHNNLDYESEMEKYIIGCYWGSTILSTVGFGDIAPKNIYEKALVAVLELLCCLIFGFFVNTIGSLIGIMGQSEANYQKDIRRLNRYLSQQNLTESMKNNVRTHLFNKYQLQQAYNSTEQNQIFSNLTDKMTHQILECNNMHILNNNNYLQNMSQNLLKKLSLMMKKVVLTPQQVLVSSIEKVQKVKLWILEKGEIEQYFNWKNLSKCPKVISKYTEEYRENTVGWVPFITRRSPSTEIKAKTFSIAYELEDEAFMSVIKESRQDHQRISQVKQEMIELRKRYSSNCLACGKLKHNVLECPRLHFIPRNMILLHLKQKRKTMFEVQKRKPKFIRTPMKYNWKLTIFQEDYDFGRTDTFCSNTNAGVEFSRKRDKNRRCSLEKGLGKPNPLKRVDQILIQQEQIPASCRKNSNSTVKSRKGLKFSASVEDRKNTLQTHEAIINNTSTFDIFKNVPPMRTDKVDLSEDTFYYAAQQCHKVLKKIKQKQRNKYKSMASKRSHKQNSFVV